MWLPWASPIGSGWGCGLGPSLCDVVGVRSIVRAGVINIEVVQNDVLVLRSFGGDPAQQHDPVGENTCFNVEVGSSARGDVGDV